VFTIRRLSYMHLLRLCCTFPEFTFIGLNSMHTLCEPLQMVVENTLNITLVREKCP
jgi:hypothetical protein